MNPISQVDAELELQAVGLSDDEKLELAMVYQRWANQLVAMVVAHNRQNDLSRAAELSRSLQLPRTPQLKN